MNQELDLARVRRQTPACERVMHFNNAGAALMPQPVSEAVLQHLNLEMERGGYEAASLNAAAVDRVYPALARLIGCKPEEIAVVENATRAWDMAFYGFSFQAGDRILVSMAEYASNYIAILQVTRRTGAVVEVVPNDESGALCVARLAEMLDERVKLVAITHIATNGGLVNPAAAIGRLTRAMGIPYLLDACQSVGQLPIDVDEIGCDILSAPGRKYLRGPRGTGFLYVRSSLMHKLEPPFLDLHAAQWLDRDTYIMRDDARRFETWEGFVAGKIGLAVAADYAYNLGMQAIATRVRYLSESLRTALSKKAGVTIHDLGEERCGIVSFTIHGQSPQEIVDRLFKKKINVSVSAKTSTLLDMTDRGLDQLVRASVHYYNSEAEIARFCEELLT